VAGRQVDLYVARGETEAALIAAAKAGAEALGAGAALRLLIAQAPAEVAQAAAPALAGTVDLILVGGHRDFAQGLRRQVLLGEGPPVLQPMSQGRELLVIEARVPAGPRAAPKILSGRLDASEAQALLDKRIARYQGRLDEARRDKDEATAQSLEAKIAGLQRRRAAAAEGPVPWPPGEAALAWRFLPLKRDAPSAPWAQAAVQGYQREVGALNLAWDAANAQPCPAPPEGEPSYVGSVACVGCHPGADAFWKTTRHAHAWETLSQAGREADYECVSCHVTGWEAPGGVCRLTGLTEAEGARLGGAQDVGCEACHGPSSAHLAAQTPSERRLSVIRDPAPSTCAQCHRGDHSPSFDFPAYRAKVIGPGHGQPAPEGP